MAYQGGECSSAKDLSLIKINPDDLSGEAPSVMVDKRGAITFLQRQACQEGVRRWGHEFDSTIVSGEVLHPLHPGHRLRRVGKGQDIMEQDTPGRRPSVAKKRINPLERTLAILVQSMRGNKVVVEMKNDVEISGLLEETDQNMNLSMVDVRYTSAQGSVRKMDVALVQGKMIRYVHIPDEVDAISNLQTYMRAMEKSSASYRRNMIKPKTTPE